MRLGVIIALAVPWAAAFGQTGSVWGVVRTRSGRGVSNADVVIPQLGLSAETDSLGKYRVREVPAGTHIVIARRIGFQPDSVQLFVRAGEDYEHDFLLEAGAVALDTVPVTARAVAHGKLAGFEERKKIGIGSFWSQDEFDKYPARRMSDFLIRSPGLRLRRGRGTASYVFGGRGSNCPSRVYLDGAVVYNGTRGEPLFNVDMLSPGTVAAVEYFNSAQVPAQYNATNSACGVLLIWTRDR
jgi:hypothetical protein